MPAVFKNSPRDDNFLLSVAQSMTATGATDAGCFTENLAIQITGDATAITLQMQRSTIDPAGTANWAPVGDPITGNPSTGMGVNWFTEPAAAWWRANVTALTGTPALVTISGKGATF